jgi:DNA (cytosine-5)-methyltransferase 1
MIDVTNVDSGFVQPALQQANCCVQPFRVLNLYACLGGNRLLWDNCEVTAVELDPELARLYQERFLNDKVIVGDAHQYLLDYYKDFDFIWSSPPCPSHSRFNISMKTTRKMIYPDMALYQEVIFLDNFFDGKYCVENVVSYYEPLIPAKKRGRHLFWTNFHLPNELNERECPDFSRIKDVVGAMGKFHSYDFRKYKGDTSGFLLGKIARNLVDYEVGKTIFNIARGIFDKPKSNQAALFG